ncbi:hypothetical protein V2J09_012371 [Rumex salicifolius]
MDIATDLNEATTSLLHPLLHNKVSPQVIKRFLLQKVFGPQGIGATHDGILSLQIGSFLMGWFGVVFKTDIANVSDQLAVGLSTGYLGSLTTFSGWNQKMCNTPCL